MSDSRCAVSEDEAREDARLQADDALWKVYGKEATEKAAKDLLLSRDSWDVTGDALFDFTRAELCALAHWIAHDDLAEVGRIIAKQVMDYARVEADESPKAMEIARQMDADGQALSLQRAA